MSDTDVLIESLRTAEVHTVKSIEANSQALLKADRIRQTFIDVGGARPPRSLARAILDIDDAKKMLLDAEQRAQEALRDIRSYIAELMSDVGGAGGARPMVDAAASEGADPVGVIELSSADRAHRKQLSKPPPNSTVFVDRRFRYETDEQGRVIKANATLDLIDLDHPRSKSAQRTLVGKLPGDHAGHLFARIFQGPLGKINLTPMEGSKVNLGQYARLERLWRREIEAGRSVEIRVELSYREDLRRPDTIKVFTTFENGKVRRSPIHNVPRNEGGDDVVGSADRPA